MAGTNYEKYLVRKPILEIWRVTRPHIQMSITLGNGSYIRI